MPGEHDDLRLGLQRLDLAQRLVAVHPRHLDVEDHHIDTVLPDLLDRLDPVADCGDQEPPSAQNSSGRLPEAIFVINDQDSNLSLGLHLLAPYQMPGRPPKPREIQYPPIISRSTTFAMIHIGIPTRR